MNLKHALLFWLASLTSMCSWASTEPYDYPLKDPYVSTVIGTPRALKAEPEPLRGGHIKHFKLKLFETQYKPDILWYDEGLRTAVAYQKHKAPLIFLIAGTGASFDSPKNRGLARAFYKAGFHVAAISSSTHPNFIISASSSGFPGHLMDDAKDMYRAMEMLMEKLGDDIEVSDFYITGYSLGGAQAAFLSKLDEVKESFMFKKVLMINPPVSLYNSVMILDQMLADNLPGGVDNFNHFLNRLMAAFTEVYTTEDHVEFNDEFLYTVYKHRPPKSDEPLAALIGISFRISSASMMFASDLMTNSGYIVPKNRVLSRSDSLAGYAQVAHRITFLEYFDELLYPYYLSKQPGLRREDLLEQLSLRNIEDYLRSSEKIHVVHNADDLILAPGEIEYFTDVFGSRAKIYPYGGHCGNMDYEQNVEYMVKLFSE